MRHLHLFVVVCFCAGCTRIMMSAYGIKQPRLLTRQEISNRSAKLNIPEELSYILDKNYFYALGQKDTLKPLLEKKCSAMISKYQQPLQVMYFDEEGKLVSFHNNCYAGGFPKLNWNRDDQFDKFIPPTTIPITDTVLNLDFLLQYLQPLNDINSFQKSKLTVIVFWCDFMLKQSKVLIKIVKKNLLLDSTHSARLFFVNTDNCYAGENFSNQVNKGN